MKKRIFLRLPVAGAPEFYSMPESVWHNNGLSVLAAQIGRRCEYVERIKVDIHQRPYLWCDEDGIANGQPLNLYASCLHDDGILGDAFLELGAFDFEKPDDLRKWDRAAARWKPDLALRGIPFPDRIAP